MTLTEDERRKRRSEYHRKWTEANRERIRAYKRNGRGKTNPETARRWRLKNPDKVKAYKRREYERNKEQILEKGRMWTAANKDWVSKYKK